MHKTAMRRNSISAPVNWLIANGYVPQGETWLHYGEGYAFLDTAALNNAIAFDIYADDPLKRNPQRMSWTYDNAYAGYVFNVVPLEQRLAIMRRLVSITSKNVYFAVRSDPINGTPFEDGVITKAGTFQARYNVAKFHKDFPQATLLHNGGHYLLGNA